MLSKAKIISVLTLAVLIAAVSAVYVSAAAASSSTCVPATNIEAIIDDSASMSSTDPDANRSQAMKLLISKASNSGKTLGALEFGSIQNYLTPPVPPAVTLFAPEKIGPNAGAMKGTLDASLKADNALTDYNAAFELAKTDNPAADARIFITDGAHNEGAYLNGHQGGPPTYVLGMGIGKAGPLKADATRLQTIANETGGVYYPNVDSENIQATVNKIDAALNCQAVAKTFTDSFAKTGLTKKKAISISSKTTSTDLTLTWASPLNQFTVSGIYLKTSRGAKISIAKKRLRIKRSTGKTYMNVQIKGLKRGKLHFKLKSKRISTATFGIAKLTTQAVSVKRR